MKRILVPTETIQKAVGRRVSNTSPSLLPERRYLLDRDEIAKLEHDTAIAEGFRNVQFGTQDDNGMPVDVLEARLGKKLTSKEVEKRLKSLNPDLIFEVSIADKSKIGIYVPDPEAREKRRFICGMEAGFMPEFTVVHTKTERRLIKTGMTPRWENIREYAGEKRGWRSVLVKLIKARVINRVRAEKVFGLPSHDSAAWMNALNS